MQNIELDNRIALLYVILSFKCFFIFMCASHCRFVIISVFASAYLHFFFRSWLDMDLGPLAQPNASCTFVLQHTSPIALCIETGPSLPETIMGPVLVPLLGLSAISIRI